MIATVHKITYSQTDFIVVLLINDLKKVIQIPIVAGKTLADYNNELSAKVTALLAEMVAQKTIARKFSRQNLDRVFNLDEVG